MSDMIRHVRIPKLHRYMEPWSELGLEPYNCIFIWDTYVYFQPECVSGDF